MKRFIKDIKKYYKYAIYAAKSDLKSEVSSSYLNWIWWILDPLLFMMVYIFISLVVFGKGEQYFPIYVFIGLTIWNFFNKTITKSVKIIKSNSSIVSKVYVPKFILIIQRIFVNAFKMMISFGLVIIMMIIYRVPINFNILFVVPLIFTLVLITFGVGMILAHFGVFVDDLNNIITVVLKLLFYMSGVFYSLEGRVDAPWNELLLLGNPSAFLMNETRKCMLYGQTPNLLFLGIWIVIGLILTVIGIKIIYKYENSYIKVI